MCRCEQELEQIRELIQEVKEQNESVLTEIDYLNRALLEAEEEEY